MAFNAHQYFENLHSKNKVLQAGHYRYCKITGMGNMEEVIQNFRKERAYFCVDATEDGHTLQAAGGGFMERRLYSVYILKKIKFEDMTQQDAAIRECRQIYRSILKKLIRDRCFLEDEMTYLHLDRIPFHEIPGYAFSGCTGLFFTVTVDIPTDLCYDSDEWTE
jgi:hypothetical protein